MMHANESDESLALQQVPNPFVSFLTHQRTSLRRCSKVVSSRRALSHDAVWSTLKRASGNSSNNFITKFLTMLVETGQQCGDSYTDPSPTVISVDHQDPQPSAEPHHHVGNKAKRIRIKVEP